MDSSSLAHRAAPSDLQPFLDAYATAFPGNVKSAELWPAMQRAVTNEHAANELFRGGLDLWRRACAVLAHRHIGDWPSLRREFYGLVSERAVHEENEEQRRLAPPVGTAKDYGGRLTARLDKFLEGKCSRIEFLNAVRDEAYREQCWFGAEATAYEWARNAFQVRPGGFDGRLDPKHKSLVTNALQTTA